MILACRENQNNILVLVLLIVCVRGPCFQARGFHSGFRGEICEEGFQPPNEKHIAYSPKVVYVVSFVAMLVSIVFTSLAAPRRCHLAKIKCGKCLLVALAMG